MISRANPFGLLPLLLLITSCMTEVLPHTRKAPGGSEQTVLSPPYLELGPMIGHVSSTNARLWIKASRPAGASLRISSQADLRNAREVTGPTLTTNTDSMGFLQVPGLRPGQRYFYTILLDGRAAMLPPYPSFQTAPVEGSKGHLRFAFSSCVGDHGFDAAAAYADMAARTNFDMLLMLGDNHYANTSNLAKQRTAYADQRQQAGYRDLMQRIPEYAIWDDHDFGPDNSDSTLKGKEDSLRAFIEHWANPAYGEKDNPGVYFKFTRNDVDFFMLDDRFYRTPNNAKDDGHKTMLGRKQVEWLKRELLASKAPIKVIVAGGEWELHGTDDSWTSFQRERDEIFDWIESNRMQGVLLLSGDRHFTAAYQVKEKWIEVTAGPLGSANAKSKVLPEMFSYHDKGKMYCVYDLDTRPAEPKVTLEVYQAGDGLVERRVFSWAEVLGQTKIKPLSTTPTKTPSNPPRSPAL